MRNSEKMMSYVKYEHELESEYRERLTEAKRKSEVREVFADFVLTLLEKIGENIDSSFREYITFSKDGYGFHGRLKEVMEKYFENSDLKAIIDRFYHTAFHRYLKIENDENTNYFNMRNV
ncbi:hypothetical protein JYK00_05090 [Thermosipho ferrireducens]|uniref:Uncharacterized protein n=1 Tax=Thermosipho ferrireducens TaxID=2571116 RepID=A0ABX7S5Q6_9BACT|nr:hypothetical protein [Thermosipho ferrireducens]QTA37131.1 hypothetical protein JYK00_05090 [Thermosipho ferrireducens]